MIIPEGKAFSANKVSCRDVRFRTPEYKHWHTLTKQQIIAHENYPELLILAEDFLRDEGQALELDINVQYPKEMYFNAKGIISSRTMDCSNVEKSLQDLILGDILNLNDKSVIRLLSTKGPGKNYELSFTLRLRGSQQ